MDMDTSKDSWNACLQYRNKQLTKQLWQWDSCCVSIKSLPMA